MSSNFIKATAVVRENQRTSYFDPSLVKLVQEAPRAGDSKPRTKVTALWGEKVSTAIVTGSPSAFLNKMPDQKPRFVRVTEVDGEDTRETYLDSFTVLAVTEVEQAEGQRPRSEVAYLLSGEVQFLTVTGSPGTVVKAIDAAINAMYGDLTDGDQGETPTPAPEDTSS